MAPDVKQRPIKVFLAGLDHDRVRLAAALKRTSMADFCRRVVMDEADRLTKGLKLDAEERKDKTKRSEN